MIIHTTARTDEDLLGILELQKSNLAENLSVAEAGSQGFVTVVHSFPELKKLNEEEQHQVIQSGNEVVGYLLAMTKKSRADIPVLLPMFELFDTLTYQGQPISAFEYMVVGQVCIAVNYRGQGLLDESYRAYQVRFSNRYAFAITEIATANRRSLKAHQRIGFSEIHRYTDASGTAWSIVLWEWKK